MFDYILFWFAEYHYFLSWLYADDAKLNKPLWSWTSNSNFHNQLLVMCKVSYLKAMNFPHISWYHWFLYPVLELVNGTRIFSDSDPYIINSSSYSGDHTNEENLQQIHKMDKNKIIFVNLFVNSSSTHLLGIVGYKSWQYCVTRNYIPPRLDVFLKNAVLHNIMQAKVNDEMGIWKVHHLTIPDENNSKCAGTETVHNRMKGH